LGGLNLRGGRGFLIQNHKHVHNKNNLSIFDVFLMHLGNLSPEARWEILMIFGGVCLRIGTGEIQNFGEFRHPSQNPMFFPIRCRFAPRSRWAANNCWRLAPDACRPPPPSNGKQNRNETLLHTWEKRSFPWGSMFLRSFRSHKHESPPPWNPSISIGYNFQKFASKQEGNC